jgi:glycerol kinase
VITGLKNEVPLLPFSEHHENALQADLLGSSVVRPADTETTALGAAYAAGLAVGIWTEKQIAELTAGSGASSIFHPQVTEDERERRYQSWNKAVERSFGLADLAS